MSIVTFLLLWLAHTAVAVLEPMPPGGYAVWPSSADSNHISNLEYDWYVATGEFDAEACARSISWSWASRMQDWRLNDDTRRMWRLSLVKRIGWVQFRIGRP
jgi:hypothetical protein